MSCEHEYAALDALLAWWRETAGREPPSGVKPPDRWGWSAAPRLDAARETLNWMRGRAVG